MEIWKTIKGFERYQVSSLGNVKSLNYKNTGSEKIMVGGMDAYGYRNVSLRNNGNAKTRTVHQLVSESFLNHIPNGRKLVVNHKDFNRLNNHVDNLEIVTFRENTNKKHLKSSSKYTGVSWSKHANKWRSQIVLLGKPKHIGYFTNEEDAHNAYEEELKGIV